MQDIHPNTASILQDAHQSLANHIPNGITVELSSEYYLDEQFQNHLTNNGLIPLPGNKLLVEFSQITRPHDLEEVIFDLGIKGYEIILAHPERYLFFHQNFNYYSRLKEMGVQLQVNALSLTPHYGKHIQAIAEKLIEKDMIDFIGTDLHHTHHLQALRRVPLSKHFVRLIDSGLLQNLGLLV